MTTQHTLMLVDPATGENKPYPSHAAQYRSHHGKRAWLINPWGGGRRTAEDVGTDPFGQLILIPNEPVLAAGVNTFTDIKAQLCK